MSSFFLKKKPVRAPGAGSGAAGVGGGGKRRKKSNEVEGKLRKKIVSKQNEEISSDSEIEGFSGKEGKKKRHNEDEEVEETPQEKKLRLAKQYLEQLREQEEEKADDEAFGQDLVAGRLEEEVMEQKGKLQRLIAKDLQPPNPAEFRLLKGHKGPVTCLVISPDDQHIFSASKDAAIIKWDVASGRKLHIVPGGKKGTENHHTDSVLCMAISSDGKYLATGDLNKLIMIWDPVSCKHLYKFTGHRGAVSGLSFRKGTHTLYSASHDRSIKVWNVAENSYVETLFGHQDIITGLDSLSRERCVSAGGRDGTVRVWKIAEESQLVFHGHDGSIDCIQLINEEHMVSGADDGSVALWSVSKKKPLALARKAHGVRGEQGLEQPYWISAVSALSNSDVIATGSHDAMLRLWSCGVAFRSLQPLFDIPLVGFVNSLKFSSAGNFLVVGVGQEHRLGRWWRIKEAKNGLYIIPLNTTPVDGSENPSEEP